MRKAFATISAEGISIKEDVIVPNTGGFVLGAPGSGMSLITKMQMLATFRKTADTDIVIIDPESEFSDFAKSEKGEVIEIVPGGKWHINPMDIAGRRFDAQFVLEEKFSFTTGLFGTLLSSPLTDTQEKIVYECVHSLYEPFIKNDEIQLIPADQMPTLTDLYVKLAGRPEVEARELAAALKIYTADGALNFLGFRNNIDVNSRFVVYDIRNVGDKLKPLVMLSILESLKNKVVKNRRYGNYTHIYVPDGHLLFQTEDIGRAVRRIQIAISKHGGSLVFSTSFVEEIFKSDIMLKRLANSGYIILLRQAPYDREKLKELFNLNDEQAAYITDSPKGQGLIHYAVCSYNKNYNTHGFIPIATETPKDVETYEILAGIR